MKLRRASTRLAAVAGLAVFSLSGCAYLNPTQTHVFYQSAEGSIANFAVDGADSAVGVRNLLIVERDSTTQLIGAFTNQTTSDQSIQVDVLDDGASVASTTITVPAGEAVNLGSQDGEESLDITGLQAKPGDNATVRVAVAGTEQDLTVQVLDDSLEYLGDQ